MDPRINDQPEICNRINRLLFSGPTGIKPTVRKVTKTYRRGISVAKKIMRDIEARLDRTADLEAWFIKIVPHSQTG